MTAVPVPPLTDAELAEIEARAAATTEEPWAIWPDLKEHGLVAIGNAAGVIADGEVWTDGSAETVAHFYTEEDAAFVVELRNAWPRLEASLRAARDELAKERRLADIRLKRIDQLESDQLEACDELRSAWAERDQALARLADANTMIGSLGSQLAKAQTELAADAPAASVPYSAVWVAAARREIDYHTLTDDNRRTSCGRSAQAGGVILARAHAVQAYAARPCPRCATGQDSQP